jgi:hypothetical protein
MNSREDRLMLLWIILTGYIVAAAAFYAYIVATAQEEPLGEPGVIIDLVEWKRRRAIERDRDLRRAA